MSNAKHARKDRALENKPDKLTVRLADASGALERLRRLNAATRYALENRETWREAQPDSWVAVHEASLVAQETIWDQLLEALTGLGLSLEDVYVEYLPGDEPPLIL